MIRFMLAMMIWPAAAPAETLIAVRPIRAQQIIGAGDVAVVAAQTSGALRDPSEAVGMEARVTLYPDRPIRPGDLAPPALVDRNQIVTLEYAAGPLVILTEGRALARGGAGETIRVMNLSSRTTISGRITESGAVTVGPQRQE